jgi:hypothetical protein
MTTEVLDRIPNRGSKHPYDFSSKGRAFRLADSLSPTTAMVALKCRALS